MDTNQWPDGTTLNAYRQALSLDNEDDIIVKAKTVRVLCEMAAALCAYEDANKTFLGYLPEDKVIAQLLTWGD